MSFTYDVPDMVPNHPYNKILETMPEWSGDAHLLDHLTRILLRLCKDDDEDKVEKIIIEEHRKFLCGDNNEPDDPTKGQMVMTDNEGYDDMIRQVASCPNRQRWRGQLTNKDGTYSPVKFMRKDDYILWNQTGKFGTDEKIWVPLICERMNAGGKKKAGSLFGVAQLIHEEYEKVNRAIAEMVKAFMWNARQDYNRDGVDPSKIKVRIEADAVAETVNIQLKIPK